MAMLSPIAIDAARPERAAPSWSRAREDRGDLHRIFPRHGCPGERSDYHRARCSALQPHAGVCGGSNAVPSGRHAFLKHRGRLRKRGEPIAPQDSRAGAHRRARTGAKRVQPSVHR